ncbi:hypothetical protein [Bacillus sp. FJAT-29814]|uniref:hypothetical protein n=1 Tax=Bacillus sp. FJAT-29814 TaxID=1729688 RepID=UPI0008345B4E|nr:hypothetical protein [Bacillus sp. FJAT-29814]
MIPKSGYVGIGKVADLSVKAPNMLHDVDDPEKCEYIVKVEWVKTVPKEDAYWIKGLKANQNSAYKLRSQYTIDKVSEFFGLDIDK